MTSLACFSMMLIQNKPAFAGPFLTFGRALDATLLLLLYFLFAGTFSLAFIHAFCLRA